MNTQKCQSQQMGVSTSEYMKVTGHGSAYHYKALCVYFCTVCLLKQPGQLSNPV